MPAEFDTRAAHHLVLDMPVLDKTSRDSDLTSCGCLGRAAAGAAGREQEPVDEDALAVVVGVVRQKPMVGVLLLAQTVARAATGRGAPVGKRQTRR